MKKFVVFLCLAASLQLHAQFATWITQQSLPTNAKRTFAASFTNGNFIYVIGGSASSMALNDVWEYDVANDSWLQKANFPGAPRVGASAFEVNGKGYLLCGSGTSGQFFDEVWEYDFASDSWLQKYSFPGGSRKEAAGFVIGSKVYFGTGYVEVYGPNNTTWTALNDFWEYTPATDTWVQKSNVPGQLRGWAVANAIGGKGYLGLGGNSNQNGSFNDFYEYDPVADTWTAKANYPFSLSDAMSFTLNSAMYVCGGINFSTGVGSAATRKYDPATNTWTTQPGMSIGVTMGAVSVNALNKAFVGTGYTSAFSERNDWIEFSSTPVVTLCAGPVT